MLLARQLEGSEGVAVAVRASASIARAHLLNAVLEEGQGVVKTLVARVQGLVFEHTADVKDVLDFVVLSGAASGKILSQARLRHFPALKEFLDSFRADVVLGAEIVQGVAVGVAAQAADPSREAIGERRLDSAVPVHLYDDAVVGSQFNALAAVLQAHDRAFAVRQLDAPTVDFRAPVREKRSRQTVDIHPNHDLPFRDCDVSVEVTMVAVLEQCVLVFVAESKRKPIE